MKKSYFKHNRSTLSFSLHTKILTNSSFSKISNNKNIKREDIIYLLFPKQYQQIYCYFNLSKNIDFTQNHVANIVNIQGPPSYFEALIFILIAFTFALAYRNSIVLGSYKATIGVNNIVDPSAAVTFNA